MKVSLHEVVQSLSDLTDNTTAFLDRRSGEIVVVTEDEVQPAEIEDGLDDFPDWEREVIEKARAIETTDHYLLLPTIFDINEYGIMREFANSIRSRPLKDELLQGISGTGAFRRFREICRERDLYPAWDRFRERALVGIARAWLEESGIAFVDDLGENAPPASRVETRDESSPLAPVECCVVIIKPTRLYFDWAQSLPDPIKDLSLAELREDCSAILLPSIYDLREAEAYVRQLHPRLFEQELESWVTDEEMWPAERGYEIFRKWFDVEIHSEVYRAEGLDDGQS